MREASEAQGLLMTDRVPQWGWVKISQKKMGHRHLNSGNSETKRDIVMGQKGKMVVTHRATNAQLTKMVLPKQKIGFLAKMRRLGRILGRGTFWCLPCSRHQRAKCTK